MGFASEAQRRHFAELVKSGKMKQEVFDKLSQETGQGKLPDRVKKPEAAKGRKSFLRRRHSPV